MVGRQRFTSQLTDLSHLRHGAVVRSGRDFDMRGMLPPNEARMRMCVMQVGKRGRWTYRDWVRWNFLWKFFPWYARNLRYRGDFCIGSSCMHWFWEDAEKKERGYCSVAVSRTQHSIWMKELEEREKQAPASQVTARQVPARQVPASQVPASQVPARQVPARLVAGKQASGK
jgi:hypothetical protein